MCSSAHSVRERPIERDGRPLKAGERRESPCEISEADLLKSESARGKPWSGPATVQRLLLLADFVMFERLTSTRLRVGLRQFKMLTAAMWVTTLCVVLSAVLAGGSWVLGALAPEWRNLAWPALAGLVLWACIWIWAQEVMSRKRFAVSRSPNEALFRAWDLDGRHLLVIYRFIPIAWAFAKLWVVVIAFAMASRAVGALDPVPLLATCVMLVTGWLAAVSRAVRNSVGWMTRRPSVASWLLIVVAAGCGGIVSRLVLSRGVQADGPALALRPWVWSVVVLVGVALSGVEVQRFRRAWRVAGQRPLPVGGAPGGPVVKAAWQPLPRRGVNSLIPFRMIWGEVRGSWRADVIRGTMTVIGAVVAGLAGAWAAGAAFWRETPRMSLMGLWAGTPADAARRAASYLAVAGAAILIELVLPVAGPGRLTWHLRFMWEAGWGADGLAAMLLAICLTPALAMGICMDMSIALVAGDGSFGATAVSVAVMAGAVLAEAVVPPPLNADETAVETGTTLVLALLTAAPVIAASISVFPAHQVVAGIGEALVIGGSFWCVKNRLRNHPSSSRTPPVATATELSWRTSRRT